QWPILGRPLTTRTRHVSAVPLVCLFLALSSWAATWALYGFHYAATPDPQARLGRQWEMENLRQQAMRDYALAHGMEGGATAAVAPQDLPVPAPIRVASFINSHKLMPEAWTGGVVHIYPGSQRRPAFPLGEPGTTGRS